MLKKHRRLRYAVLVGLLVATLGIVAYQAGLFKVEAAAATINPAGGLIVGQGFDTGPTHAWFFDVAACPEGVEATVTPADADKATFLTECSATVRVYVPFEVWRTLGLLDRYGEAT
jgi:hypothetical protein